MATPPVDYPTILSAAGVGAAAVLTLWRINTELKREIKKDVSRLGDHLRQDIKEIRESLTRSEERISRVSERVTKLES